MERHEAGRIWLEHLIRDDPCFDHTALQGIKDIKTSHGRLTCTLPVEPRVQNRYGTLHGGCTATLVDTVGSAALVTMSLRSGVSLSISVNYISAMPGGEDAEIDARVVKVGQSIATIDVLIRRKNTGQLVSQGVHVKFLNVGDRRQGEPQGDSNSSTADNLAAAVSKRGYEATPQQSKL